LRFRFTLGHYPISEVDGRSRGKLLEGPLTDVRPPFIGRERAGGIRTWPVRFYSPVPNLKPSLALDDELAVQRAQFELANVTDQR